MSAVSGAGQTGLRGTEVGLRCAKVLDDHTT